MLCLNYALELTRGNPLGLSMALSHLDLNAGVSTGVAKSENGKSPLAGQVIYNMGDRSAQMTFLLPDNSADLSEHGIMLDYLAQKAGEMGALNLLADIAETHPAFELLRKHGFSVYCWENVWKLPSAVPPAVHFKDLWKEEKSTDEPAIRNLYQTVVPPLVQTAEPFTPGNNHKLIYRQQEEIMGFIDTLSGPNGFYLRPVIHPSVEDIRGLLGDLILSLSSLGKPVYFQVRSYQSWIADALEDLDAKSSPRRAVLVKHLAVPILSQNGVLLRKRVESPSAEPTATIVQNSTRTSQNLD